MRRRELFAGLAGAAGLIVFSKARQVSQYPRIVMSIEYDFQEMCLVIPGAYGRDRCVLSMGQRRWFDGETQFIVDDYAFVSKRDWHRLLSRNDHLRFQQQFSIEEIRRMSSELEAGGESPDSRSLV